VTAINAAEYNEQQMVEGKVTWADFSLMVKQYQLAEKLTADGKLGPKTLGVLRGTAKALLSMNARKDYAHECNYKKIYPLPSYGGREPEITSDHWLNNPSRAPGAYTYKGKPYTGHQGCDIMYRYSELRDPPKRELPGDHYEGSWWVPPCTEVSTVAEGKVIKSEWANNQFTIAIEHPDGWITQYRHLRTRRVFQEDKVTCGEHIGLCGGLAGKGLVHLHFEVYRPKHFNYGESMWPTPFLADAEVL